MTTLYQRTVAACQDCVQALVPEFLSQSDCDAAKRELARLSAAELAGMLTEHRQDARYMFPELRPILARHGF